jgi:hypothetical protein
MSGLRALQGSFQDYVLGDGAVGPDLAARIRQQGGLSAQDRLAIYHNAYRVRMRDALNEAYERTWTYTGDAMFGQLASDYLDQAGSTFTNLRWFGGNFATFLRQQLPEHQFVAELAAFEWALGLAFDAPDAAVANAAALRALAPPAWADLVLILHPSVQLLCMDYNSVAIWQTLGDEREPPEAVAGGGRWLVWRKDNQPHFRSLAPFEAEALAALDGGTTFGDLCERASGPDVARRMGQCLHDWIAQGLLMDSAATALARSGGRIGIE